MGARERHPVEVARTRWKRKGGKGETADEGCPVSTDGPLTGLTAGVHCVEIPAFALSVCDDGLHVSAYYPKLLNIRFSQKHNSRSTSERAWESLKPNLWALLRD